MARRQPSSDHPFRSSFGHADPVVRMPYSHTAWQEEAALDDCIWLRSLVEEGLV